MTTRSNSWKAAVFCCLKKCPHNDRLSHAGLGERGVGVPIKSEISVSFYIWKRLLMTPFVAALSTGGIICVCGVGVT